jgi:Cupin domain
MPPIKTFKVFGEPVDVLVNAASSRGVCATTIQHVPPGGGPPPHSHLHEDETFYVLEGDFEFLREGEWHPLAVGETVFGGRRSIHTFAMPAPLRAASSSSLRLGALRIISKRSVPTRL